MDRAEISRIAHEAHPIAAPVSDQSLRRLVAAVGAQGSSAVLDLGCGQGEWLLRALQVHPDAAGVGVDLSRPALREAERAAAALGLSGRVRWALADAAEWPPEPRDVVLCIGASHAFEGLDGTLAALRSHLRPGGQALLGDGIWERPPTPEAQAALQASPDDYPDLAGLVARARHHGFEITDGHVSTIEEWDDYEWAWTGSLIRWALTQPIGSADRDEALTAARDHRDAWLGGYRQQLGFATLALADVLGD